MQPERSKFVAVITGAIAILLGMTYLVIVQLLDFRGDMVPAPIGMITMGNPDLTWVRIVNPQ